MVDNRDVKLTIGVFHKGKFVSDSQITITNRVTGKVEDKIFDPGFTKIQRDVKKRKKKQDIHKTIQFSGNVRAYFLVLLGLKEKQDELARLPEIEALCTGDANTPPTSFQLVFRNGKEKKSWTQYADEGRIIKIGFRDHSWDELGHHGSGSGVLIYNNTAKAIIQNSLKAPGVVDLCSLARIAIDHDDYCGGEIMKCSDINLFSSTHGDSQIAGVQKMLGGVSQACVAEAHIDVKSAIKNLDAMGVEYEVVESPYLKAQKNK